MHAQLSCNTAECERHAENTIKVVEKVMKRNVEQSKRQISLAYKQNLHKISGFCCFSWAELFSSRKQIQQQRRSRWTRSKNAGRLAGRPGLVKRGLQRSLVCAWAQNRKQKLNQHFYFFTLFTLFAVVFPSHTLNSFVYIFATSSVTFICFYYFLLNNKSNLCGFQKNIYVKKKEKQQQRKQKKENVASFANHNNQRWVIGVMVKPPELKRPP